MHSIAALEQISEKLDEERLTDENDFSDDFDDYNLVPN